MSLMHRFFTIVFAVLAILNLFMGVMAYADSGIKVHVVALFFSLMLGSILAFFFTIMAAAVEQIESAIKSKKETGG